MERNLERGCVSGTAGHSGQACFSVLGGTSSQSEVLDGSGPFCSAGAAAVVVEVGTESGSVRVGLSAMVMAKVVAIAGIEGIKKRAC